MSWWPKFLSVRDLQEALAQNEHKWSKWEPYEHVYTSFDLLRLGRRERHHEVTHGQSRQKRHCVKCGITQDIHVSSVVDEECPNEEA